MPSNRETDPNRPPGWSYNPSAWRERIPLLTLAAIGLIVSLVIAMSQTSVFLIWDPFFGSASSYAVTHSAVSRLLPVPDGWLGVAGYICDLIFGALGGEKRWRARPWVVLVFAVVIIGLGLVSLALTILQGAVIGQWCTLCLVSAAVSTVIFGLGIGEALASLQYLARVRLERGVAAMWRALWGAPREWLPEQRSMTRGAAHERAGEPEALGSWTQVVCIALGIWLLVSPSALPSTAQGALVARIVGPIVIWVGVLALRGVTRPFRALNVLSGLTLIIVPWVVPNTDTLVLSSVLVGWATIILSIPRGGVRQRTGGGWWAIIQPELVTHAVEN